MTNSSGFKISNSIEIFVLKMSLSWSEFPPINGVNSILLTTPMNSTNSSLFISDIPLFELPMIELICWWKRVSRYWLLFSRELTQRNNFCNLQRLIAQLHFTCSSNWSIRLRHSLSKLNKIAWVASDFQMDKSFS